MNVCADGAGGQRFAKFHGIDLNDKLQLHAAITNPDKQFAVMANEMKKLFGDKASATSLSGLTDSQAAEWFGQQIAEKYERCSHCKRGDSSYVERGNVAADIFIKGYATNGGSTT